MTQSAKLGLFAILTAALLQLSACCCNQCEDSDGGESAGDVDAGEKEEEDKSTGSTRVSLVLEESKPTTGWWVRVSSKTLGTGYVKLPAAKMTPFAEPMVSFTFKGKKGTKVKLGKKTGKIGKSGEKTLKVDLRPALKKVLDKHVFLPWTPVSLPKLKLSAVAGKWKGTVKVDSTALLEAFIFLALFTPGHEAREDPLALQFAGDYAKDTKPRAVLVLDLNSATPERNFRLIGEGARWKDIAWVGAIFEDGYKTRKCGPYGGRDFNFRIEAKLHYRTLKLVDRNSGGTVKSWRIKDKGKCPKSAKLGNDISFRPTDVHMDVRLEEKIAALKLGNAKARKKGLPEATPTLDRGKNGKSKKKAAVSCLAIQQASPTDVSGTFWLDPDGKGGDDPFKAFCDMTTDGGGWTMCFTTDNKAHLLQTKSKGTYGVNGYRTNCMKVPFQEVIYVNHVTDERAMFQRQDAVDLRLVDNLSTPLPGTDAELISPSAKKSGKVLCTNGGSLGKWRGREAAQRGNPFQLVIGDGQWLQGGFMFSGYSRKCLKLCGVPCGDDRSRWYRVNGEGDGVREHSTHAGVIFGENGHKNGMKLRVSTGIR